MRDLWANCKLNYTKNFEQIEGRNTLPDSSKSTKLKGVKLPGSVSDSYDTDFGTSSNRELVVMSIAEVLDAISEVLQDAPLKNIVEVAYDDENEDWMQVGLTERELRLIRFSLRHTIACLSGGGDALV